MGREGEKVPEMTDEICENISNRYIELYEKLTGKKFVPAPESNSADRIAKNVLDFLANLD